MAAVKNTAYVFSRRAIFGSQIPSQLLSSSPRSPPSPSPSPFPYRPLIYNRHHRFLSSLPNNTSSHTFTLNTGDKIPAIGLGTWQSKPHEVQTAVEAALKGGYRHIDTAAAYGNEKEVGDGIKASGVPRDQIWLTTKLFNTDHKRVAEALDDSLAKLGTDYVDLYLIHWPASVIAGTKTVHDDWNFVDTWREMQKLVGSGKVRNIGVSNFAIKNLETLLNDPSCKVCPRTLQPHSLRFIARGCSLTRFQVIPAVNQIELHPCNPSPKLIAYNTSKGIHSTGYSCLGSTNSPLYTNDTLKALADAKGKTVQQVLLVWGIQKGWSVIPKSVTPARIAGNFDIDGWSLTDDEMKTINGIADRFKVCDDSWLPVKVFFGDDE